MDGRSASEKEGRFCEIKKVVSCSSDGLKRHKVLVVLDRVRREGEDEPSLCLVCLLSLAALELFTRLPPSVSISLLFQFSAFLSSVSGVSGAYTVQGDTETLAKTSR